MTFDEWWKTNGIEMATYAEKSAARKGFEAGAKSVRDNCAELPCGAIRIERERITFGGGVSFYPKSVVAQAQRLANNVAKFMM